DLLGRAALQGDVADRALVEVHAGAGGAVAEPGLPAAALDLQPARVAAGELGAQGVGVLDGLEFGLRLVQLRADEHEERVVLALGRARAVAHVVVVEGAVVAVLHGGVEQAVAAHVEGAVVAAGVEFAVVGVVALLVGVDDAVAAEGVLALVGAVVAVVVVAVVALL